MSGHAGHMFLRPALPLLHALGVHIIHIGCEAEFGVYHEFGVVGIIDYHVGDHRGSGVAPDLMARRVADHALRHEMHAFLKPGSLEQVHQQHLPEVSLNLRMSGQGVGKVSGLLADALRFLHQGVHHLLHRRILRRSLLLVRPHGPVELPELLLYRLQQFGDGLGVLTAQSGAVLLGKKPEGLLHLLALALESLLSLLLQLKPGFGPLFFERLESLLLGLQSRRKHCVLARQSGLLLSHGRFLRVQSGHPAQAGDD